jgi:hypothetical protein
MADRTFAIQSSGSLKPAHYGNRARNMPQVCPKTRGRTPTTNECWAYNGADLQKCVVGVTGIEPVTSAV